MVSKDVLLDLTEQWREHIYSETVVERDSFSKLDLSIDMEEITVDQFNMEDPEQAAIWKTVQILMNQVIYADSYLEQ